MTHDEEEKATALSKLRKVQLINKLFMHIKTENEESKRCMSGFISQFGKEFSVTEIQVALKEMVRDEAIQRYGNGKRHCYKTII